MAKRGYRMTKVRLRKGKTVKLYSSVRVANAVQHLQTLSMFDWSRVLNLCEAMYEQGKKQGALEAFTAVDAGVAAAKAAVPHRMPGRPRRLR